MVKDKNKGFSSLALIIIAVLILGGGYWVWKERVLSPTLAPIDGSPTSITDEPPTSNTDTSNWKTYRDDKYGFEFKYPLQWTVVPSVRSDLILSLAPTQADESGATSIWLSLGVPLDCKKMGWGDMHTERYKEVCLGELSMGMQAVSQATQNLEDAILSTFRFIK